MAKYGWFPPEFAIYSYELELPTPINKASKSLETFKSTDSDSMISVFPRGRGQESLASIFDDI